MTALSAIICKGWKGAVEAKLGISEATPGSLLKEDDVVAVGIGVAVSVGVGVAVSVGVGVGVGIISSTVISIF